MSYGSQLNIFRAKSNQYGPDWNAIICVDNANELHVAVGDAREALHGTYNRATQTLRVPTGAEMRFSHHQRVSGRGTGVLRLRVHADCVRTPPERYTTIIELARSRLRSRTVPGEELRYEYCCIY
jgi:hypothetical protein